MKLLKLTGLVAIVSVGLIAPATAGASGEIPEASLSLEPRSGSFFTNAFATADWRVETGVTAPNPPNAEILPTRSTTLRLPPASQMTFNPGSTPVCPDNQVGPPPTNVSVPVPDIVSRCPNAIIGNGTATFLLNRLNKPNDPAVSLNGVVLVFNGGLDKGQPRLKFWAFSYDTGVAIYTESTITPQGVMAIPIPLLTYDSAVNSLNVNLPGKTEQIFVPIIGETVTLPGGKKSDYVKAKCTNSMFPFSADFLLGRRLTDGTPTGQQENFEDVGESTPCTGVPAPPAKLAKPTISGPSTARRNQVTNYSVTIRNTGVADATGVKVSVSGRGASGSATVPNIPGGESKKVTVKAKFKTKGKITATFTASSSNAGKQSSTKKITVR